MPPTSDLVRSSNAVAMTRAIADPAVTAKRTLARCREARLPTHLRVCRHNLDAARALRAAGVPSLNEVNGVIAQIERARKERIDERSALLIISSELDKYGREVREHTANLVVGLVSVVVDTEVDDIVGLPTVCMSPLVVSLAMTRIVRTFRFFPTPAELREACSDVSVRLNELRDWLTRARDTIEQIEEIIVEFGDPDEIPWFDRSGLSDEIEV